MKILVTYLSKIGFTKRYAEWISQELSCDMKEISTVTPADIRDYDLVIHGGWIMGGMNPEKIGFFGRTIVKLVTKKPLVFTDNTDKSKITGLVEAVKAQQ